MPPRLRENFWIQIRKESLVQPLHDVRDHVFFYHKRQIDLGGALRNHADFDVRQFTKHARCDAGSVAQILADQADDGLASFIFYVRQFGQVGGQRAEWIRSSPR